MTRRSQAQEILRRIGTLPDEQIDLAEAALELAALDRPGVELARYRAHLAELVHDVAVQVARGEDDLDGRTAALIEVLVHRHRYVGDNLTYDDLQNANLMRVIDRRRGLPVTLGILFLHAARGQGWDMVGLNFPGHFLVRLEARGARIILDPFDQGAVRTVVELRDLLKAAAGAEAELTPDYYRPVGNREILLRLQNNLKLRLLRSGRSDKALEVVERMLLFAPNEPALWREAGLLHAHLGHVPQAIAALETYIRMAAGEPRVQQAALLLQQLRNRLH